MQNKKTYTVELNMHLLCSGYPWTYALWTAKRSSVTDILSLTVTLDICVSSHNKTNYKRYQHVINNAITISNFLLSYDNYSDNNIHFSWSTILIFKLSSTLETESLKVETTSNCSVYHGSNVLYVLYICMHVCMYVCMYVCIYIHII